MAQITHWPTLVAIIAHIMLHPTYRSAWLTFAQTCAVVVLVLAAALAVDRFWPGLLPAPAHTIPNTPAHTPPSSPALTHTGYAQAAERAMPAIVSLHTSQNGPRTQPSGMGGLGSGVILSPNGYILTNYHVIEAADAIRVALADGRSFPARLVGSDPDTDLAVLRVNANNLPAIDFAPEDSLRVGDIVLAIGNPFNIGQTVTLGIVSALQRKHLGLTTYENFIQTDAAINPGNSGGALVDTTGRLVGINSAIFSRSGGNQGIGFAVPVSMARQVMEAIITQGEVTRGWIGVEIGDLTPEAADTLGIKETSGAIITGVLRNGPAERAGLLPGDLVLSVNQQGIHNAEHLMTQISILKPGRPATIQVFRSQGRLQLILRVEKRPRPAPPTEGGEAR